MKANHARKVLVGSFVFLTASLAALFAQGNSGHLQMQEPQLRLPLMEKSPVIDGVIHPEEWAGADLMQGFMRYQEEGANAEGGLTPQRGEFWVGADAKNLYIAVRTETPPGGKLLTRANAVEGGATIGAVFADDAVELRVVPDVSAPPAESRLYLALFNARGTVADSVATMRGGVKWHGNWKTKHSIIYDYWHCEIALPWEDIGVDSPLGKTMGIRVGRDWRQAVGADQSDWGLGKGAFDDPSTMPRVTWDAAAPVIQVVQLQDSPGQDVKIKMRVYNPGPATIETDLDVNADPVGSPAQNYSRRVVAGPRQTQEVTFDITNASPDEDILTHIQATSADGKQIYYLRDFTWRKNRPKVLWNLHPDAAKRAEIKFAYFPSYNAMHVEANLTNLPNRQDVKAIDLTIRRKGAARPLAKTTISRISNNVGRIRKWDVPSLPEGEYELVAQLQGVTARPIVQSFVRYQFAWQGNKLGRSDIVVAPFTPLKVTNDQVSVVLRQHQTNGVGLWNQVTAAGKPLLKAPMRLEAAFGGKTVLAQGIQGPGQRKVLLQKPTEVVTEARWQAGALKGSTRNEWDYDGMVRTTFTLSPPAQKVDRLTLVVPLDSSLMPLMHQVTFGGDYNYAGEVKAGNGVVWQSSQAPGNTFIGTYVPYIWIGAQERGLAVFGENDAGWITDDKTSCQEIVRKADGTLELRLKLVQKSTQWTKPRKITIGFQATPVKPMPKNWRMWTVNSGLHHSSRVKVPGLIQQSFMGTTRYWGSVTGPGAIYPADGDLSLWHEFARLRKTGQHDPGYVKKWSDIAYKKLSPELRKAHEATMTDILKAVSTQPQSVLIYTDASGMRPDTRDGQTFLNEWSIYEFPQREWDYASSIDYAAEPLPSYRDSRAWYYQKSLTTFNDGIYWDVAYFKANYNTITTGAYVRADGRVQPSTGIWNVRALVKRGAVLAEELRKPNRNMVHMSGANIAPINGFAATQADWELKYGAGDFQDKFPRDYIQAQSIGRQAGLMPIVLLGPDFIVGTPEEAAWQYRTAAGVMLTHELKHWWMRDLWGSPDVFWANYDKLLEFGYGQPNVKVYNYWEEGFPAKISGQTSALAVSKPGSTALVICDYGDGGEFTVNVDTKKLALTGSLKATNMETGEPIALNGNRFKINLKKHDFAVIRIDGR